MDEGLNSVELMHENDSLSTFSKRGPNSVLKLEDQLNSPQEVQLLSRNTNRTTGRGLANLASSSTDIIDGQLSETKINWHRYAIQGRQPSPSNLKTAHPGKRDHNRSLDYCGGTPIRGRGS